MTIVQVPAWGVLLLFALVLAVHVLYAMWFERRLSGYEKNTRELMQMISEHRDEERDRLLGLVDQVVKLQGPAARADESLGGEGEGSDEARDFDTEEIPP